MASTIPTAMTNLVAALQGAELPALDGPTVSDADATDFVVVGFNGADDVTAVEAVSALEGLEVAPTRERYTIRCAVMCSDGETSALPATRARAYDLLDQVSTVLATDPTLGGAVMVASLADHTLEQQQDASGALATIRFGVQVDAYTSR